MRTSLWFVPGLMALGALALATITPFAESFLPEDWTDHVPLVYSGSADGARTVLSTIATAMIGVAGVVFSMTIVSLQLASSQFGPRLLRTFLRDRGNQIVLGTFLGTFLYCIVVLPAVHEFDDRESVPHLAITFAVLEAIVSLAMLVYYIDHVAQSIHADAVMHAVGRELETAIDQLCPDDDDTPDDDVAPDGLDPDAPRDTIVAESSGYLRFINDDTLVARAAERDVRVHVRVAPGAFVLPDDPLLDVVPAGRLDDDADDHATLCAACVLGVHRTTLQDLSFTFEQIAEMATRALSPSINDPTTAIHCIDRIAAGLAQLVQRRRPPRWRVDDAGTPRLEHRTIELSAILDVTIVAIARSAGVHRPVWTHLFAALFAARHRAVRDDDRATLHAVIERLRTESAAQLGSDADRADLAAALEHLESA